MFKPQRSQRLVAVFLVWLALIPLFNIHHDATVHPLGEAGHHAEYGSHIGHHHHADETPLSLAAELLCDGWHGFIDSPPVLVIGPSLTKIETALSRYHALNEIAVDARQLLPRTRAPPRFIS